MPTSFRSFPAPAAAALGAVVVAVAALAARPATVVGAPANDPNQPPPRTITVSASATVSLVPDVAHVGLGITVTKPTVEAARSEAARIMTAIVTAVKKHGVADRDIRTGAISLSPQYASECAPEPGTTGCASPGRIVGYTMSEQVDVTVRNLDVAGLVVDDATAAGATNVAGIWFGVDDPDRAQSDARVEAIRKARGEAETMAAAAGTSLGAVVSITDAPIAVPYPYPFGGGQAAPSDRAVTPVQPGTQDVQATVTVVYSLG